MPRQGRDLETLIARIEAALSPLGAIVKSPDFLEDRITGQGREVDVSIRGRIGSAELLIICECRDRSALQDVRWIEQIAQKRSDVGASKAIAVSSSSFTEPALRKAKFLEIDTRRLEDLTPEAIADWFQACSMTLTMHHADIVHASFDIGSRDSESKVAPEFEKTLRDPERAFTGDVFVCKRDGKKCSISTIWSWVHETKGDLINPCIPISGERIRKTIVANFRNVEQRYQLPMVDGLADIFSITFVADLWLTYSEVPIDRISTYRDGESELIQSVQYNFSQNDRQYVMGIHRKPDGQTVVTAEITALEDRTNA